MAKRESIPPTLIAKDNGQPELPEIPEGLSELDLYLKIGALTVQVELRDRQINALLTRCAMLEERLGIEPSEETPDE